MELLVKAKAIHSIEDLILTVPYPQVVELLVKGKAIYSEALRFSKNASNQSRRVVELIEELDNGPKQAFYVLEQIVFTTLDGDDVKAATVVLQLA